MRTLGSLAVILASAAALTSCATTQEEAKITNCGHPVNLQKAPERVTLLAPHSVNTLAALGVLDKATAKAGKYPEQLYSPETNAQLANVPTLTDELAPSGHLNIGREEVVATNPDLVIGYTDQVTPQTMGNTPVVTEPVFCEGAHDPASWDSVTQEVELCGQIFDREDKAREVNEQIKQQVAQIKKVDRPLKVAVLYPSVGGGVTYAYGSASMATPVVETAGLDNVFGDVDERVFEVSAEQIVAKQPDVIVVLYQSGDPVASVRALPGAETIPAVQNDKIMALPMNYAEPPGPLAVEGARRVAEFAR